MCACLVRLGAVAIGVPVSRDCAYACVGHAPISVLFVLVRRVCLFIFVFIFWSRAHTLVIGLARWGTLLTVASRLLCID